MRQQLLQQLLRFPRSEAPRSRIRKFSTEASIPIAPQGYTPSPARVRIPRNP